MRIAVVTSALLLLAACNDQPAPKKDAKGPSPAPAAPPNATAYMFQPDSPIIITDANSIHYRKHNDFYMRTPKEAVAQIERGRQLYLSVENCGSATCSVPLDTNRWMVDLFDNGNHKVATLKYPDGNDDEFVELRLVGSGSFDPRHLMKDTFEYPGTIYKDGAPGVSQMSDRVASVTYGSTTYRCANNPCQIRIGLQSAK